MAKIISIESDTGIIFESGWSDYISVASLDSTHFVIVFRDRDDFAKGKVRVGSVDGTTITLGGVQTFEIGAAGTYQSVSALDSTHFVIAWNRDGGECIAGSVAGTTITLGVSQVFDTSVCNAVKISALDSTHFVISYQDVGDGQKCKVIAGKTDGDVAITITTDSSSLFETTRSYVIPIKALDSTHFVIAIGGYYGLYKGEVIAGKTDGDVAITIAADTSIVFENEETRDISLTALDSTHFLIAFRDELDSEKGKVIVGKTDGDVAITITADTGSLFESGNPVYISVSSLDSTNFVIAFRDTTDSNKGKVMAGETDGDVDISISADSASLFESGAVKETSISALDDTHIVIAFQDYDDGEKGKVIIGTVIDAPVVPANPLIGKPLISPDIIKKAIIR